MHTEDLAAKAVTVVLRRVKKPEPLLAYLMGWGSPFSCFNIAQCSFTILKKNPPVHSFYWICKLLLLLLNNHFYHQPCGVGEVCCVCNKTRASFYLLTQRVFICRRWSSSSDTVRLGTSERVQRPETEKDVNSWVASVVLKFSLVLLLCTGVSIWMKAKCCSHDATLLPSASPGNLFPPECPDRVLPSFLYVTFKFSLMQYKCVGFTDQGTFTLTRNTQSSHWKNSVFRFSLWFWFSFLFGFCLFL